MSRARLPFGLTEDALVAAMSEEDPESLAAASRMRARYGPELAVAALTQAALRRQARAKFGDAAAEMFFTRAGLEQATRPEVADHHASRFLQAGVHKVVDLGCGIGSDSIAFARAGLDVVAVEVDPETAEVAQANLAGRAEVICADANEVAEHLIRPGVAVFCDPARRNDHGRVWRVEDFEPRWSTVMRLLDGEQAAGVKLGPALPRALIPEAAEAEWITHRGETVEAGLWAGSGATPGQRSALIMPNARLIATTAPPLPVRDLGSYLYEPAGAVIRAGVMAELGAQLDAGVLDPQIAYLTSDRLCSTPFAAAFEVRQQLPFHLKALRTWVREAQIGVLEIKKRGVDIDPAELRRRLRLAGPRSATMVMTRTPSGAIAVIVERA
ncbi:MAG TPA: methyltransferase domain-containing protein [Propionibacteriaceae bacterium]|nr:methyltransferase domain-containing protein [Propionibacteriaceae bacterium]